MRDVARTDTRKKDYIDMEGRVETGVHGGIGQEQTNTTRLTKCR